MRTKEQLIVSAVIPVFNGAPFIAEAIESVLRQTRPVDEVIVVDDGSTDETARIAESFGAPVRVLRQANCGDGVARNFGISRAKGDLLAFLDSDDRWLPHKIERQLKFLEEHPDLPVVSTHVRVFDDSGRTVRISDRSCASFAELSALDFLVGASYLNQSAFMMPAELAHKVHYPAVRRSSDMIMAAQLRLLTPFGRVEEVLTECREHERQKSRRKFGDSVRARMEWVRAHWAELGLSSPLSGEMALLKVALDWALVPYYERDLDAFRERREEVLGLWSAEVPLPAILRRPLPPRLVFQLWDAAVHGRPQPPTESSREIPKATSG